MSNSFTVHSVLFSGNIHNLTGNPWRSTSTLWRGDRNYVLHSGMDQRGKILPRFINVSVIKNRFHGMHSNVVLEICDVSLVKLIKCPAKNLILGSSSDTEVHGVMIAVTRPGPWWILAVQFGLLQKIRSNIFCSCPVYVSMFQINVFCRRIRMLAVAIYVLFNLKGYNPGQISLPPPPPPTPPPAPWQCWLSFQGLCSGWR